MREYANAYHPTSGVSDYPFAPMDWSERAARRKAREEGLELSAYHLEVIRVLQAYFFSHEREGVDIRDLHTALHESFLKKGGIRYLYVLFPLGPVVQGCRLAGLPVPLGVPRPSFGSIQ